MASARTFYFDRVSQIRMPSWSRGRVALVGDAAACPAFLAGQGSGPVWFPVNVLIIEGLRRFAAFFGDDLKVEHPTGSGSRHTLAQIADDLEARLVGIFLDDAGRRPVFGGYELFQSDPRWHDQLWFHEYFHGDTGAGLGASHQTGWTGLVAELLLHRG